MNWRERASQARVVAGILHGGRAFGGPFQASFSLSNRCNLRCIHCYFYSPALEQPNFFEVRQARLRRTEFPDRAELLGLQKMDADAAHTRAIIDELLAMGTARFHFSGSGEPFMHAEAPELMSRVKQAGARCFCNTNGVLLRKEVLDELIRAGVDELRVTTMAGTPETYEATHPGSGAGVFARLRENLLYLAERKAALRLRKPEVSLITVLIKRNAEGIEEFVRFAKEIGADRVIFHAMDDVSDPTLAPLVPDAAQAERVRAKLQTLAPEMRRMGLGHNVPAFLAVFNRRLDTTELYKRIPCYMGWLAVRFQVGGNAYPCHRCYDTLGNAYERGFGPIWNGDAYREFRRAARAIHRRGTAVEGCRCDSCCHNTTNLRVFRALHPLGSRLRPVESFGAGDTSL